MATTMKRLSNRKVRLGYSVIFRKNGKEVGRYSKQIKTKIIEMIKASSFSECELKVTYQPDVYNSGTFITKKDAIEALRVWTEKALLDYIEEGTW